MRQATSMATTQPPRGPLRPVSTDSQPREIELSVVMPCLNEAETLATCVRKAVSFFEREGVVGEVVVADNGSTDGSQQIAHAEGARVVDVPARGYGSALIGGIEAAHGRYVVMGDADDSYDFSALKSFLRELRGGAELVMGNRFAGGVLPGAMPFLHKWLGNPVLSFLGRLFFRSPVGDFHCGLRGFSKEAVQRLQLRATGMEFASEMVVKATLRGQKIREVPIVLHPDGRSRAPHLRTWRDGWRHLRFLLLFSPKWLFLFPGLLLFAAGLLTSGALLSGGLPVGSIGFDIHTLLIGGLACLLGYQLIVFAVFTKAFAISEGFQKAPGYLKRLQDGLSLEIGLIAGGATAIAGLVYLVLAVLGWREADFGGLDPQVTMRQVIPGSVLLVLGLQTMFSSFFLSVLTLRRR